MDDKNTYEHITKEEKEETKTIEEVKEETKDNLDILGTRLKEIRTKNKMSQKELAKFINVTPASLSAYETGTKKPSLGVLVEIAKKCNVSLDWLCGLTETENQTKGFETYSDIIKHLLALSEAPVLLNIEEHRDSPVQINGCLYWALTIYNCKIQDFFNEWNKMFNLLCNSIIDSEVYNLWVEKTLKKYNIPLPEYNRDKEIQSVINLSIAELSSDYDDDKLPF